jgi:rhodanese-related sulfurtransferase
MATGKPEEWAGDEPLRAYRTATFADLAAEFTAGRSPVVLDVRRNQERAERHIAGSVHIPIHEVLDRLDEVPAGPVWVHCAGGYRAGVVAALLDAHGIDVVAIDDSFDNAGPAGLYLTTDAITQEIPA